MYDNKGNLFDDVSSLNIKWSSDNKAYGEFLQGETLFEIKQHVDKNENGGYQGTFVLTDIYFIIPFLVSVSIIYPLKLPENIKFYSVFRGIKREHCSGMGGRLNFRAFFVWQVCNFSLFKEMLVFL